MPFGAPLASHMQVVIAVANQPQQRRFSMKSVLAVIGIIATLLWTASAFAAADTAAGKELYSKKCASCHGATGEGNEKLAKMLKVEIPPLGSKDVQAKSDSDLKKAVLEGTGKMKAV